MKRKSQSKSVLPTKRRPCIRPEHDNDNDAWISLHHSSIQSLANSDYDGALDSATQAVKLLDALKAKVLDTCVTTYAKKGLFSKALEAAETMIECTPLTAAGYLRAGETLALQGNHKRAIAVYKKGREKVPMNDDLYLSLEEQKAASESQLNKRVDFLAMLPADIAHMIVSNLGDNECGDFNYRITCMNVSKEWHQVVADCASAWRDFSFTGSIPADNTFCLLPAIGKHVQNLVLCGITAVQSLSVFGAIINRHLGNIQCLNISNPTISRERFLMALSRLENTLTQLSITDSGTEQTLSLESIFAMCPRLEALTYCTRADHMVFGEETFLALPKSNIRSLNLTANSISIGVLEAILQLCPHLQDLHIKSCTSVGLLVIGSHCPRLKRLGFNGDAPNIGGTQRYDSPGMQALAVYEPSRVNPKHIFQLLGKSRSTLRGFSLSLPNTKQVAELRWDGLKDVKCENMTHFTYAGGPMEMHAIVAKMIQNCKALEHVSLQSNQITGSVFDEALSVLPNLKFLELKRIQDFNQEAFSVFFNTHANMGKTSSLRRIALDHCEKIPDSLLEQLATVQALERIDVIGCNGPTNHGFIKFFVQLHKTNTLKAIHLERMDAVVDVILCFLPYIASLQEIVLKHLARVTGDTVETVVAGMKHLDRVELVGIPQIGRLATVRLQKMVDENRKCRTVQDS